MGNWALVTPEGMHLEARESQADSRKTPGKRKENTRETPGKHHEITRKTLTNTRKKAGKH